MNHNPELIRLSFFIAVFVLCACWEWLMPRKVLTQNKINRWLNNLGLIGLNSLCLSLLMPILAFEAASWAEMQHIGLFNWLTLPTSIEIIIAVIVLDFVIYAQHVFFHFVPWLWRLHRMHHADQDIDVTTGTRFHPIEIVLSLWIKIASVLILGIDPLAVLIFEILLNASAMFNHSNAKLNLKLDHQLRWFIVTPDMHRVHHSVIARETHSNFGFFLSWWDRLFDTYRAQPELGHDEVKIGIPLFRQTREQWLDKMLTQPFREK
ncbi:sterol desaturase family protein [Vibrio aestuarianus]|uniref:Sterol desaturase n=1 Tax=Vibrio aestuarianus TaxID=28171 RepID=A0AAX3U615_9VIBR|nr:sterol desaturase family protein [Vibrio aestuarianus]KOE80779.1 sterol desaturase [Vibrio alginolyticus]MDE1209100.1 sterol desaturase family protein [Vibrio aestuarianus]MDE1212560.1 sterol desaturase family protein [Vibrio aestuarianus]MDE1216876.1 sterol desaturase family protein [Vibrio aestuarianus]MDE1228416.1 sterol desaturase family protein [Vibrio aestuarianus]